MKTRLLLLALVFGLSAFATWFLNPPSAGATPPPAATKSERSIHSDRNGNPMARQFRRIESLASTDEKIRQLIALAHSIPADDIAAWHRFSLTGIDDLLLRQLFQDLSAERWLAHDPEKFIDWKLQSNERQASRYLAEWAADQPEAAMAFILKRGVSEHEGLFFEVIDHLLKDESETGFIWAAQFLSGKLPEVPRVSQSFRSSKLIERMARLDLDRTISEFNKLPFQLKRSNTIPLAQEILARDFMEGIDFLISRIERRSLVQNIISCLQDRPDLSRKFFENARELPDGLLEEMVFRSSHGLGPGGRLDWMKADLSDYGLAESRTRNFKRMAAMAPSPPEFLPRRLGLINDENFDGQLRKSLLTSQIRSWPENDPRGLTEWLAGLKSPGMIEEADTLLASRERVNQAQADTSIPEQLQEVIAGKNRKGISVNFWNDHATRELISTYNALGSEEKSQLIEQSRKDFRVGNLPSEFRRIILQDAANSSNPEQLAALKPELESLTWSLARENPRDAATWLDSLPDSPEKISATHVALKIWQDFDPEGASEWQQTLPPEFEVAE